MSYRLPPCGELAGNVEQAPACVAQAEEHGPRGKDLDFLAGRQYQTNMSARAGRLGVTLVQARTGMLERLAAVDSVRPLFDIGHPEEVALRIDDQQRFAGRRRGGGSP